jgi:hypothetical protein
MCTSLAPASTASVRRRFTRRTTGAWFAISSRSCVPTSPSSDPPPIPAIIPAAVSSCPKASRTACSSSSSPHSRSATRAPKSTSSSATACGSGRPAKATTTRSSPRASGRRRCSSRYSRVTQSPGRSMGTSACTGGRSALTEGALSGGATRTVGQREAVLAQTQRDGAGVPRDSYKPAAPLPVPRPIRTTIYALFRSRQRPHPRIP